jgi:hypothetical protein
MRPNYTYKASGLFGYVGKRSRHGLSLYNQDPPNPVTLTFDTVHARCLKLGTHPRLAFTRCTRT